MLLSALYYIKGDLKGLYMLGDAGSNFMGFFLGSISAVYLDNTVKVVLLILLVLIHAAAEKVSFSQIIKNNRLLNYFDMMGR